MLENTNPTSTTAWAALEQHFISAKNLTLKALFEQNSARFEKFSVLFKDQILLDYSKNLVTEETLEKLLDLAKETRLSDAIQALFQGEKINCSDDRAVLHVALRNRSNTPILVDGKD